MKKFNRTIMFTLFVVLTLSLAACSDTGLIGTKPVPPRTQASSVGPTHRTEGIPQQASTLVNQANSLVTAPPMDCQDAKDQLQLKRPTFKGLHTKYFQLKALCKTAKKEYKEAKKEHAVNPDLTAFQSARSTYLARIAQCSAANSVYAKARNEYAKAEVKKAQLCGDKTCGSKCRTAPRRAKLKRRPLLTNQPAPRPQLKLKPRPAPRPQASKLAPQTQPRVKAEVWSGAIKDPSGGTQGIASGARMSWR